MKRLLSAVALIAFVAVCGSAHAKVKVHQKPDKSYDFKAVNKIAVEPVTSFNVDYGKVDEKRLPKIRAILEKTKKNLRKHMVVGAKQAKSTIPFYYKAPNRRPTTLILRYNFDKFDNGDQVARVLSPLGHGSSKVAMTVEFINAQNKQVVAKVSAKAKAKGGFVPGGADSEVLWGATNQANADVYRYLKKLTGLEYDFWSGVTRGTKTGVKSQADIMKEEKRELKR
jgi:hypothetical protein